MLKQRQMWESRCVLLSQRDFCKNLKQLLFFSLEFVLEIFVFQNKKYYLDGHVMCLFLL